MKLIKKFTALALALILLLSLPPEASAAGAAEEITVRLGSDVAVKYINAPQPLTDAAGNPVCPLFYNDAIYLPARAIGNMLGIGVDWDADAKAVLLSGVNTPPTPGPFPSAGGAGEAKAYLRPDITVQYNGEPRFLTDAAGNQTCPILYNGAAYLPLRAVSGILGVKVYWEEAARKVLLGAFDSADAEILGEDHVGCDWVEIDWSTASSGYFRVKLTKQLADHVLCTARWRKKASNSLSRPYADDYPLAFDQWTTIPLLAGSTEYRVAVTPVCSEAASAPPGEEAAPLVRDSFRVSFTANVDDFDLNDVFLMSTGYIDYENAPETRAKALEITQACETDAEKITAVFHYIAENIQYDHALVEAEAAAREAQTPVPPRDLALDHILNGKKGVCEHYALLMAGMLRSLGIPCKVIHGLVAAPGGLEGHAWVSVRPGTGELDREALGAGTDGDWIRLDPTNSTSQDFTSNDENYSAQRYC